MIYNQGVGSITIHFRIVRPLVFASRGGGFREGRG